MYNVQRGALELGGGRFVLLLYNMANDVFL